MRVVSVVPARGGLSGASLALVHILLGVKKVMGDAVQVRVVSSAEAMQYPAFKRLWGFGASIHLARGDGLPSPLYWLGLALTFLSTLRYGRHDIAHFSTPKTFVLMYPLAKLVARRTVLSIQGYSPYELGESGVVSRLLGMFAWFAGLRLADRLTACSDWLRKVVARTSRVSDKLETLHNPVDFERFEGGRYVPDGPVVLVCRLHPVKGVDLALKALSEVCRGRPAPEVYVVGDGPERAFLEWLATSLGLEGSVKFLGTVHNVEGVLSKASIVLMPSRYEPFGMPAAEAGASGKPVIAAAVGGLGEIVVDNETGLLFLCGDHVDLAAKLGKLLEDKEMAARMGEKARERVKAMFSAEAVGRRVLKVYLSALRGGR